MILSQLSVPRDPRCDAESLWNNPEEMMKVAPYGYVRDGDMKIPFWATCEDPLQVPGCQMVLVKFLDGSPVAVRYKKVDIVQANMCHLCHRDLDFIFNLMGQEGLILHNRAHERDNFIKALELIRDGSRETHTRNALDGVIKVMTL